MPARIVRCSNCAEIVEAEPGICSSCGAPLRLLPTAPPETTRSYAEKYRGSEFDPVAPPPAPVPVAANQNGAMLMVGLGVALILVVVAVSAMLLLTSGPKPTAPPMIYGRTSTPTPAPTPNLVVQHTFAYLSDPNIRMKMTVDTSMALDSRVNGQPMTVKLNLSASFNDGASMGHMSGPSTYDFVCLKDKWWTKPNGGRWGSVSACRFTLMPLFGLLSEADLKFVSQETADGVYVYHLVTTNHWRCDPARIALLEMALPLNPTEPTLDLWVTGMGEPIRAELTANYDAPDGTRLLALSAKYAFSDVGKPVSISAPE